MGDDLHILTLIELDAASRISTISLECLALGKKLAGGSAGRLDALIVGGSDPETISEELRHSGVDTTYLVENSALSRYDSHLYPVAVEKALAAIQPELVLIPNTVTMLDLAPRVAFSMDLPLLTDCTDIRLEGGDLLLTKPVYSGNVTAVFTSSEKPCLVTLRKSSIEPLEPGGEPTGEVVTMAVEIDAAWAKTDVIESGLEETEGMDVDKAAVVVSGGRGLGGPEGFEQLREVADLLGAAIGASRPPCDLGWAPCSAQVGQTGAIISPALYIAVGISGSMQHISGMARSKVVVAINNDPKAAIFDSADYGVVGDFEEVLPAFTASLKESRAGGKR